MQAGTPAFFCLVLHLALGFALHSAMHFALRSALRRRAGRLGGSATAAVRLSGWVRENAGKIYLEKRRFLQISIERMERHVI